jgi:hypothetical protein
MARADTGLGALDWVQAPVQRLAVALCAWTLLNDRDAAHDLMKHAIHNTAE